MQAEKKSIRPTAEQSCGKHHQFEVAQHVTVTIINVTEFQLVFRRPMRVRDQQGLLTMQAWTHDFKAKETCYIYRYAPHFPELRSVTYTVRDFNDLETHCMTQERNFSPSKAIISWTFCSTRRVRKVFRFH